MLVAITVEFDNEFERRVGESGYPSARLSLVIWSNVMRIFADGGLSLRELSISALVAGSCCLKAWWRHQVWPGQVVTKFPLWVAGMWGRLHGSECATWSLKPKRSPAIPPNRFPTIHCGT